VKSRRIKNSAQKRRTIAVQALTINQFPALFKEAFIHPVPKQKVSEFSPITLLSHLGKLLEIFMTWQIRSYFLLLTSLEVSVSIHHLML
jgi:hypothetical protein